MSNSAEPSLVVPIKLNARYVDGALSVKGAKADFRRLPWTNGKEDFNSSNPFLGGEVLSAPFENQDLILGGGVHLHWVLPQCHRTYSTAVDNSGQKKQPPAAPNRWLISRNGEQQWIVESDYINAAETQYNKGAITVPSEQIGQPGAQPHLYLGRQMEYDTWAAQQQTPSENYWKQLGRGPLTAFGYGDFAFNSFYPSCRSVFGFYDGAPDITGGEATYSILGWYSDGEDDILQVTHQTITKLLTDASSDQLLLKKMCDDNGECPQWLKELITRNCSNSKWPKTAPESITNHADLRAQLLRKNPNFQLSDLFALDQNNTIVDFYSYGIQCALGWLQQKDNVWESTPTRSLYHGVITVNPEDKTVVNVNNTAVGNSGAEALSAFLANELQESGATNASKIEEELNALLLEGATHNAIVDAAHNLREELHSSGFKASPGGSLWTVRAFKSKPGVEEVTSVQSEIDMPLSVARQLSALNKAQTNYEKGVNELSALQSSIYSGWCKYMYVCYPPRGIAEKLPDIDAMRYFLEGKLAEFWLKKTEVGALKQGQNKAGSLQLLGTTGLSKAVCDAYNTLQNTLSGLGQEKYTYELSQLAAPRYYQSKDPVVLFARDEPPKNKSVHQNGSTTVLWNQAIDPNTINKDSFHSLMSSLGAFQGMLFAQTSEAWSPQLLEWEVAFAPEKNQSNLDQVDGNYGEAYITQNFKFSDASFDLQPLYHTTPLPDTLEYSGTTYVSSGTKTHFLSFLEAYLLQHFPDLHQADFEGAGIEKPIASMSWGQGKLSGEGSQSKYGQTAYLAYCKLLSKQILTQSLGGFYQGLLQQANNLQLPIADPLGFESYRNFTELVSQALLGVNPPVPLTDNRFIPIASGQLNMSKLHLVDHFGEVTAVDASNPCIASSLLAQGNSDGKIWLQPRLAQEARLNFRWLAADTPVNEEVVEMNSHPLTSPICGWLLPNFFDNSIDVYDADGKGLMTFTPEGLKPFYGSDETTISLQSPPAGINANLLMLLQYIEGTYGSGNNKIQEFISKIEQAQTTIAPEYFSGHDALALLIGKPIAVVRANISLDTKDGWVSDEGWIPFLQETQGGQPSTDNYEHVPFPIRLGDKNQLDDGLIAFTIEDQKTGLQNFSWVKEANPNSIQLTLQEDPITLVMLMDPHGIIHAGSGILPVKTINIPPEQYTRALKNMSMIFRIQPLLTSTTGLELSLPLEQGYQWSWLEQKAAKWTVTPNAILIGQEAFATAWEKHLSNTGASAPPAKKVWADLQAVGGITALPKSNALFEVNYKAIATYLSSKNYTTSEVEMITKTIAENVTGITPYNTEARFYPKQHLVEGYLQLTPYKSTNNS